MGREPAGDARGVVVPALDAASSVAVLRSLGDRGIRTVAVSEHDAPPGFSSRYTDEAKQVPDPAEDLESYATALCELAERDDVATVVPVREPDAYVLAREKDRLARHVGTPWPALETLRWVQDRVALFEAADRADVATPETRILGEWDDWERETVVKPRYTFHAEEYDERFTESVGHANSTEYVPAGERPDRDRLVEEMGHVPLVQEHVPTTEEYAFFALCDNGEPVATFQHRQHRGYKYVGGPSAYRESVAIPALAEAGGRLLAELSWHGLAMVEFLRDDETGEFQLMEVNPRFWTSLPFTVQAGADFPHYYWLLATDRSADVDSGYEVGVAGHLLRGELLYLHSILCEEYPLVERPSLPAAAAAVCASIVRHPHFDYLSVDDPKPFLRDVRNVLDQLVRSREQPVIRRR